jgi:hypothetical protein
LRWLLLLRVLPPASPHLDGTAVLSLLSLPHDDDDVLANGIVPNRNEQPSPAFLSTPLAFLGPSFF